MRALPLALLASLAGPLAAQEVWLQVEALPTLGRAQASAAAYAEALPDVAGFALGGGWYGIALGPYPEAEAQGLLARLKAEGAVPADAFLADPARFRGQVFPAGAPPTEVAQGVALTAPVVAPALRAETPEEAAASEALLPEAEKLRLQVALTWAGVYDGPIDGAYGRGTRAAMAAWQAASGFEPTGILTTAERAALIGAYDAILDGLGLDLVRDDAAGIEMRLPLGVVAFAGHEPPFARFDATSDIPAQVLLISQAGDAGRLAGLYEIMQSLEIVPPEGPRERSDDGFVIEGLSAEIASHTEVALADGQIKGFTLVWPAGDEERRSRLLAEMRASFSRLPGTLDPLAGAPTEEQSVDMVSGLEVRQPRLTATGFFVDGAGTAVTTEAAVASCERVTLDEVHEAAVVAIGGGLAVLEPLEPLAPRAVAAFRTGVPRIDAAVAVAGFPYGGALAQPALTFGTLADIRGLAGEEDLKRLTLTAQAGDAGGPVLDAGGAVLGMLLPRAEGGTVLPADTAFALDSDAIVAALRANGVEPATTDAPGSVTPERLTRDAAGLTVLVSCW